MRAVPAGVRSTRPRFPALVFAAALVILVAPRLAAAEPTVPCEAAEDDVVEIDGMVDDWTGVKPTRGGGVDKDASFDLRCLVTATTAWLVVDVRDERVTRGSKADDHVTISLGTGKPLVLTLYPGVDRQAPKRTLGGKAVPKWLVIEDSLQPAGWSVELAVPLAKLPGWSASAAGVALAATLADGDIPRGTTIEHTVEWRGALAFAGKADLLTGFLAAARLPASAVTLDVQAELDPTVAGKERVVVAGDRVALLTDQFAFVQLPVARALDVLKVELIDLRGDGSRVIAARLRQRGGGAVRDVLMLWGASRGQLEPLGAVELGVERGAQRLVSTWKLAAGKPWAKRTGGARKVIEVRAQPAEGWDEDSYQEAIAHDAESIHLPWDDDRIGGVLWLGASGRLESAPIKR